MTKKINEDGAAGGMAAGTGGFSSASQSTGPVAGYDVPLKNRIKKQLQKPIKRAAPPKQPGVMISDNN
jgi:hypothetical protein